MNKIYLKSLLLKHLFKKEYPHYTLDYNYKAYTLNLIIRNSYIQNKYFEFAIGYNSFSTINNTTLLSRLTIYFIQKVN